MSVELVSAARASISPLLRIPSKVSQLFLSVFMDFH
jgi:hypothetical protein